MDLKGSKTEQNLHKAFELERRAYFEYLFAAKEASNAGFELAADMFHQTAQNEAEHAEHEFNFLGGAADVKMSVRQAIKHEEAATVFYQDTAGIAEEEGFGAIADFFRRISRIS